MNKSVFGKNKIGKDGQVKKKFWKTYLVKSMNKKRFLKHVKVK